MLDGRGRHRRTVGASMTTTTWEARLTAADELPSVAAVLARAFEDDPLWTWTLGRPDGADRRKRLARFFFAMGERMHARHQLVYTAGDFAGAAVWAPPGQWRHRFSDEARVAPAVIGAFGLRVVRLLRLLVRVERAHLREPHYYLFAIGADPALQGRGVGSALLRPMLARCDAERMPAYLESSNPANVPFYKRHGFQTTGEIQFTDGPLLTLMRRPPSVS
jgi:GNAT superfamily N-acetyltransferase